MNIDRRPRDTIRAPKRGTGGDKSGAVSNKPRQPLKPPAPRKALPLLLMVLAAATGLLVQQNQSVVMTFFNRPMTTARIETELRQIGDGEVRSILAAYMGRGFFNLDVARIKQELEGHPWIARASVKRVWPGTLSLTVVEESPIARWRQDALLNQYAEIFRPPNTAEFASIPALSGPEGSQLEVMRQYQVLSQLLFASGLRLNELSLSHRGSWLLELENGVRVVAGRENVVGRVKRFLALYDRGVWKDLSQIRRIDLRYTNGIAVQEAKKAGGEVAAR